MSQNKMPAILVIAGSDSSGGAGIQADIKTITCHKMYAMTAITALTAQNTKGVTAVLTVDADFLGKQIDSIFTDIIPDAIKIGMVANVNLIKMIAERLKFYYQKLRLHAPIVVDPVMVAQTGATLLAEDAISSLQTDLLPLASIITPNIKEAEILTKMKIHTKKDMEKSASLLRTTLPKVTILLKGGHLEDSADDYLLTLEGGIFLQGEKILSKNTHGTGCTLSSAIAANLARHLSYLDAVKKAKEYVRQAILKAPDFGKKYGPLNHMHNIC